MKFYIKKLLGWDAKHFFELVFSCTTYVFFKIVYSPFFILITVLTFFFNSLENWKKKNIQSWKMTVVFVDVSNSIYFWKIQEIRGIFTKKKVVSIWKLYKKFIVWYFIGGFQLTMGGDMKSIMQKSENARLTTKRLLGVRRDLVVVNIKTTIPFPHTEINPKQPMTKPRIPYHSGFIGGKWYQ